ncbi:hypothetical protein ACQFX6_10200 [Streptomyces sp. DSM 41987]|uniref:hypothetical protein n=1 Tax=Streptomyces TaxID=1883 RepID=UPI0018E040DB|nr:hypothetical protein [Streptomyces fildesensis]
MSSGPTATGWIPVHPVGPWPRSKYSDLIVVLPDATTSCARPPGIHSLPTQADRGAFTACVAGSPRAGGGDNTPPPRTPANVMRDKSSGQP